MRLMLAALALGLALPAWLPVFAAPWMRHLLPLSILLLLLGGWLPQRLRLRQALLCSCLLLLLAGLLWTFARAGLHQHRILPAALAGVDLWVIGDVVSLPRFHERSSQFDLRVRRVCFQLLPDDCDLESDDRRWRPYHAALQQRRIRLNNYDADLMPRAGERWLLRVRLQPPRGLVNPAGPDLEAGYFQRGISARGYVRETRRNQRLGPGQPRYQRWRQSLADGMQALPLAADERHLLNALIVGERAGLSEQQWQLFSQTGTTHLVVISGLHIGFVTALVYLGSAWLLRLSPWLMLRVPVQRAAAPLAMLAAMLYAMLAGFLLPTQRALIMVLVAMLAICLGQRQRFSLGLLLALNLVLLRDPLSVASAGFWLSFLAVAALLWVFGGDWRPQRRQRRVSPRSRIRATVQHVWQRWLRPQWVVFVALFVPLAMFMGQVSLMAPVANVIAIPLVSFWVVPLALTGALLLPLMPTLALWLLQGAAAGLRVLQATLQALLDQAATSVTLELAALSPLLLLCTALATGLLLLPPGWPARYLIFPLLLPLGAALFDPDSTRTAPVAPGHLQLTVLDVGQGLAVVLRTHQHTLVYDTGPGANVVGPYLRYRGRSSIDTLVISHWHQDHSAGLASLLRDFTVQRLLAGRSNDALPDFEVCRAGMQWHVDGVQFEILHPAGQLYRSENDNSCVIRVVAGSQRLLLTGDVEAAAERDLLALRPHDLAADVLLAPHHGSASSSSQALLAAVNPQLVIYSAGYQNRFGHPHQAVRQRVVEQGAEFVGTPAAGAISLQLGDGEAVVVWRGGRGRARYWRLR